ncbi:MAG: hypothetical protein WC533_01505 [Candidatus Pacearchaeota archaeon]
MEKSKIFFITQGGISIILGLFLLVNVKTNIIGAVIGTEELPKLSGVLWGLFFMIMGIALFISAIRKIKTCN